MGNPANGIANCTAHSWFEWQEFIARGSQDQPPHDVNLHPILQINLHLMSWRMDHILWPAVNFLRSL